MSPTHQSVFQALTACKEYKFNLLSKQTKAKYFCIFDSIITENSHWC
jgi:hypothetical protein